MPVDTADVPVTTAEVAAGTAATGATDAPTVALHGFTQTGRAWNTVAERLRTKLITPDLPGHGDANDERPGDLAEAADLVAARVADDLRGRPALWIGYSLGGRVLLHLALRHPTLVSGLVLVSTTAGIDEAAERAKRRRADDLLAAEIEHDGTEPFIDRWLAQPLFATLAATDEDRADRLRNTAPGLASSLRSCGTGTQRPLWKDLVELRVPTLIVTGTLDTKFSALGARLAATLPHAVHRQLVGAGHACHLERPDDFVDALRLGRKLLRT